MAKVTTPEVPPPVRPVPAVTPVMPPEPKLCPGANAMTPLLFTESPVSTGVPVVPNSRLSVPNGAVVLFAAGSACQRNT